jgi:hypothetical protein
LLAQDLDTIISIWGLLLGLFGGIAIILFMYQLENRNTPRPPLLISGIVLLILAPAFALWLVRDIFRNQTAFFIVIGILFGMIIALMAYLAVRSYNRYRELPPVEQRNFGNKTVFLTWVCVIDILAMVIWLGLFFWMVVFIT